MRAFQYMTKTNKTALIDAALNVFGMDGWELVAITREFQRQSPDERITVDRAFSLARQRVPAGGFFFVYTFKRETGGG